MGGARQYGDRGNESLLRSVVLVWMLFAAHYKFVLSNLPMYLIIVSS